MSVFSEEQVTPDTQIQEPSTEQLTSPSVLGDLVGEGRKFNDVEALAKGKLEADRFIEQMKLENNQLKEDLNKQQFELGVSNQLKETASASTAELSVPNNNDSGTSNTSTTQSTSSETDIASLVEQTLKKRELEGVAKNNIAVVESELDKIYGTEAGNVVRQKASELGLPLAELEGMASKSPAAFMQLLGKPAPQMSPMVQGSIRTEGTTMQGSSDKNFGFYQNLRRTDPKAYYSTSTQRTMMADADRLGSKFYS
tara:strand:+ start:714 stop:1478 length:765 start_codon:yes stop_codon:yes gene_type:complete